MLSYKWYSFTLLALYLSFSSVTAFSQTISDMTILVDPSSKGGFTTIQAAIDSVPSKNQKWFTIDIKPGIYREKVRIPYDKPFIFLKGAGMQNTFIVWNDHGAINESPTFTAQADNILAKDITFTNSYNSPPATTPNPMATAVAALIQGDKSMFYRCGFFGLQDTLWDEHGRHYYKNCTIEGAVDFIFGDGQSHYESCTISVPAASLHGTGGYITAQGRDSTQDTSGFVFKNCNIVGNGKTYLGRPWRKYARVLYYNTQISDIIVPLGWDAWFSTGYEDLLTLTEYNCSGPGANMSGRVKWEKKLSESEVNELTSISFIDNEGWVKKAFDIMGA